MFVTFSLVDGATAKETMMAVSADADFSYDYHDLRLTRI